MTPAQRTAAERAALAAYCPRHDAQPGCLCTLLEAGGGAIVTTGICSTRMASTLLDGPARAGR